MSKAYESEVRQDESAAPSYQQPLGAILYAHTVVRGLSDRARTAWCRLYRRSTPHDGWRLIAQTEFDRALGAMHLAPGHAITVTVTEELVEAALLVRWDESSWLVHDGQSADDALLFASLAAVPQP